MNIDNLSVIDYNDPILHDPCERWDFLNPAFDIVEYSQNLVNKMLELNGLGLSSNQVGVPYKIFAMRADPNLVVVNPRIIEVSDEMVTLEEGCLSYPGLIVKVKRPLWIKARFNYPNGQAGTYRFEGMTARVFLHEFDHIEFGHTFMDQANSIHREKAKKDWKLLQRKRKAYA